jgi:hypothetical protein
MTTVRALTGARKRKGDFGVCTGEGLEGSVAPVCLLVSGRDCATNMTW